MSHCAPISAKDRGKRDNASRPAVRVFLNFAQLVGAQKKNAKEENEASPTDRH
jgi:hypothetical protein